MVMEIKHNFRDRYHYLCTTILSISKDRFSRDTRGMNLISLLIQTSFYQLVADTYFDLLVDTL